MFAYKRGALYGSFKCTFRCFDIWFYYLCYALFNLAKK